MTLARQAVLIASLLRFLAIQVWEAMRCEFVGGGDVTIPDDALILLCDSDTRVPEDCMFKTVGEFLRSPRLAFTQHRTTPFDEQRNTYWQASLQSPLTRRSSQHPST